MQYHFMSDEFCRVLFWQVTTSSFEAWFGSSLGILSFSFSLAGGRSLCSGLGVWTWGFPRRFLCHMCPLQCLPARHGRCRPASRHSARNCCPALGHWRVRVSPVHPTDEEGPTGNPWAGIRGFLLNTAFSFPAPTSGNSSQPDGWSEVGAHLANFPVSRDKDCVACSKA